MRFENRSFHSSSLNSIGMMVWMGKCPMCKKEIKVEVHPDELEKYQKGALAQDAFPNLSPGDRELLISGTCDNCWEKMWKDEEDDD